MIRLVPFAGVVVVLLGLTTAPAQLALAWTNNLLTISGPNLPGEKIEVWYLEAFCRRGSTTRDWRQTTWPHKTQLLSATPQHLRFLTQVPPDVELRHEVRAGRDVVEITFEFVNRGAAPVDIEWFQPACIRVERFTGRQQSNYTARSFIFTTNGLTTLDRTRRTEEAVYRGGQVYVPAGIDIADVNPRPICLDRPVNGLLGCFSEDGRSILATASDRTHELFEGVYVCLHSDPHVGGLKGGETKRLASRIYLLTNNVPALLERYQRDFPEQR